MLTVGRAEALVASVVPVSTVAAAAAALRPPIPSSCSFSLRLTSLNQKSRPNRAGPSPLHSPRIPTETRAEDVKFIIMSKYIQQVFLST